MKTKIKSYLEKLLESTAPYTTQYIDIKECLEWLDTGDYLIPLKFKVGDIIFVYDRTKKVVQNIRDGYYLLDGCHIPIIDQYKYDKMTSFSQLQPYDYVRLSDDPNCYSIREIKGDEVVLKDVHGMKITKTVKLQELLTEGGYNISQHIK